jgi:hypothetical protein
MFLNSATCTDAIEIASMILKVAASLLIENEALFPVPNNTRDDSSFFSNVSHSLVGFEQNISHCGTNKDTYQYRSWKHRWRYRQW